MSSASEQTLKIATWNLERPQQSLTIKNKTKNEKIRKILEELEADILVLTETNSCINPGKGYFPFATSPLLGSTFRKGEKYQMGENRVTVWSRREFYAEQRPEYCHSHSAICVSIHTPLGELNIYGTVIGIYGRGGFEFDEALDLQTRDWERLKASKRLCVVGDFNSYLKHFPYFTKLGKEKGLKSLEELEVEVPTRHIPDCVDHIALSQSFLNSVTWETDWQRDSDDTISDHMWVSLTLKRPEQPLR